MVHAAAVAAAAAVDTPEARARTSAQMWDLRSEEYLLIADLVARLVAEAQEDAALTRILPFVPPLVSPVLLLASVWGA
jgi:hypothetical protein